MLDLSDETVPAPNPDAADDYPVEKFEQIV